MSNRLQTIDVDADRSKLRYGKPWS